MRRSIASLSPALLLLACGGGGGGGSSAPDPVPNTAPTLAVPAAFTGGPVSWTYTAAVASTASLTFTATDAEGDPLTWQVTGSPAGRTATGVSLPSSSLGTSYTIGVAAVGAPAATTLNVLVEDPNGGAASIDVLVVRSGAPSISGVTPAAAFATAPQQVTLSGNGFELGGTAAAQVRFGGASATAVTVVDDGTITCLTPSTLALGATAIQVQTQYGTDTFGAGSFTTYAYPVDLLAGDTALDGGSGDELAVDSDGQTLQAVWVEGGALVHQRSLDGGATWSATQFLSGSETPAEPQVLVRDDDVQVVWIGDGQTVLARTSSDGGQSFASAITLNPSAGSVPASAPRLAATGNRRHCIWLQGASGSGAQRVVTTSSTDAGASWRAAQLVSDDGVNQSLHAIGCEGSAVWIAFYQNVLETGAGVYTSRSSDGGVLFTAAVRRSATGTDFSAVVASNTDERAWLVWVREDELEYILSVDDGETWTTQATQLRGMDLGPISSPAIACEADRLYAVYVTGAGADTCAFSRIGAAGAAPQHVTLSDTAQSTGAPELGVRGNYLVAVWRGGDVGGGAGNARLRLVSSVDLGVTFTTPTTFGDANSAQELPRLVFDDGRIWLGWRDYRGVTASLYANRTEQ